MGFGPRCVWAWTVQRPAKDIEDVSVSAQLLCISFAAVSSRAARKQPLNSGGVSVAVCRFACSWTFTRPIIQYSNHLIAIMRVVEPTTSGS